MKKAQQKLLKSKTDLVVFPMTFSYSEQREHINSHTCKEINTKQTHKPRSEQDPQN